MNEIQIQYFMELCKTLSFTKAAQNLYVSQPAISKQIILLEKELGFQLFERTNKSVSLTPVGKLFYEFFQRTINDYEKTIKNAQKIIDEKNTYVVIGFLEGWDMSKYLPYITKALFSSYPNISIEFVSYNYKDLSSKLESKEIDLAISLSPNFEDLPNIKIKEITTIPSLLFFSSFHPLANKINLSFNDFKDETFFVFSDKSKITSRDIVIKICNSYGFTPKISVVPNIESMILNVKNGLGVAIFDDWIQYKHNPVLKYIQTNHKHKIIAAWNKSNKNSLIDSFIKELVFILNE